MIRAFTSFARAHPRAVLAAVVGITLLLGAAAPFTRWDADPELLTIEGSPELAAYRQYLEAFGSDELIVIAFEREDLLEPSGLTFVRALTDALFELPGVENLTSLDTAYDVDFAPFGPFARPIVPDDPELAGDPVELLATLRALPMTRDALIDESGHVTSIVVKPGARSLDGEARRSQRELLESVEAVLAQPAFSGTEFHLAGSPVFNRRLEILNTRDNAIFTPIAVVLVALMLVVTLRRLAPVALAMSCVGGTLAWVRGAMTLLDYPLNTTTSLLPPLLMVLAVSVAMHVLTRYLRERAGGAAVGEAVDATVDAVFVPAGLAAGTTALGFGSLLVSPIASVRTFGAFAALGSLASFVLGAIALPAALRLLRIGSSGTDRGAYLEALATRIAGLGIRQPGPVLAGALLLAAVSFVALPGLRVSTHDGEFFPDDDPLNVAYDFIESRLAGVTPLELIIESDIPGALRQPESLAVITGLQDRLEELPETIRGISIADWIREARQAIEPAEQWAQAPDAEAIDRASFVLQAVAARDLPYWVRDDWSKARITSRSLGLDSAGNDHLLARLEETARQLTADQPHLRVKITGLIPVFARMEEALLDSQIRSFSLALVCVLAVFIGLFRSLGMAALAMLPNLLPILMVLGGMARAGIPLDVVTVMVASVNLGIVVDDTLHVMHAFRDERKTHDVAEAALRAAHRTGRAVVTTSIVLSLGFATLALSDFQPTAHFGALTAVTVALALFADLLLLPALLVASTRVFSLSAAVDGELS